MNKNISLGLTIEQQNPNFLDHNIMSYCGDYKRLTFKISHNNEIFWTECQIKEFNTALFHAYILIKNFDTMYISDWRIDSLDSEHDAVLKICEFLDKRFP